MAKSSAGTFLEWLAIIVGAVFFGPALLKRLGMANAGTAAAYSPNAALQRQEAQAINTAGGAFSNALQRALSGLTAQSSGAKGGGFSSGGNHSGYNTPAQQSVSQVDNIDYMNLKTPQAIPQTWDQARPGDFTSGMPVVGTDFALDNSAISTIANNGNYQLPQLAEMQAPDVASVASLDDSAMRRILEAPDAMPSFDQIGEYNYTNDTASMDQGYADNGSFDFGGYDGGGYDYGGYDYSGYDGGDFYFEGY